MAALLAACLGYLVVWGIVLPELRPLATLAQAAVWVVAFIAIAEGTGRMRLAATAVLGACVAMEAFQNQLAIAQATRAERLRELDARAAAHDERLRLARELHDVVANGLSAVAMRITAARHVRRVPATQEGAALDEIGRQIDSALGELRSMLGALRSDRPDTDHATPPSLGNVRELADQTRQADADVTVVVNASPVALPSMLDLAAYRIVQEALTNVARHARPPHATVTVDDRPDSVRIRIDDNGTDTAHVHRDTRTRGVVRRPRHRRASPGRRLNGRGGTTPAGEDHVTVSILLADDQDMVRTSMRVMIDVEPDLAAVGEAADGTVAVELAARLRPDVVVMDIRMPHTDGVAATRQIMSRTDPRPSWR